MSLPTRISIVIIVGIRHAQLISKTQHFCVQDPRPEQARPAKVVLEEYRAGLHRQAANIKDKADALKAALLDVVTTPDQIG